MTDAERDRRWNTAKEHYRAASLCFDHGFHGASVTRSYYAAYQGIWVAVGDPPLGRWRHHGLIHQFCWGQWTAPPSPPTALAPYRQRLRTLYDWRTDADYTARMMRPSEARDGLTLAQEILTVVAGCLFPKATCTRALSMDTTQLVRPGHQTVAIAAVELAERLHHLFPKVVVKPSEPYEDEDICLTVYGPWEGEELDRIRRQIYALEFEVYDKYAVEAMVKALPLSFLPGSGSSP